MNYLYRLRRAMSVVVLSFFLWTFGGVFDIAYAIKNDNHASGNSQNQRPSSKDEKPQKQKPEEDFEKDIEDIYKTLTDKDSDEDTKKSRIRGEKGKLDSLDVELKKKFNETEKFLKDKGLPNEILDRHYKFVKHYEDNLKELKTNLDNIEKAKTRGEADKEIEKAKAHLEKVKPPKKQKPLDPNKLPHRTPETRNYEIVEKSVTMTEERPTFVRREPILIASTGTLEGLLAQSAISTTSSSQTLPTAADLSQTLEVQATAEIQAKAAELEHNPVKIYEYVRNNFEYEPYYGSLKGAQQTLLERAGNDFDQASLLIALLRTSNIPARYVYGTIELSMDRLMNWLGGVTNANAAAQIMATNGIPGTLLTEGGVIKYAQFEHVWVEAYVDMFPSMGSVNRVGSYWTPIDPSMKEMQIAESVNISKFLPFDETAYLNSADEMPPVLSYIYKLKDYYNTNYDYNFMRALHAAVKIRQEFGVFPGTLSYAVINSQRYSEIPDIRRHKINLGLSSPGLYGTNTVSVTKTYPEIVGKTVAISYIAASATDQAVINNYGGLLSTPAYLINVKPEMRLNNVTILTGPEMGMGSSLSLSVDILSPNINRDVRTANLTNGISYAIGLPALDYSGKQLVNQVDILKSLEGTLQASINAMDSRAGELLQNIAIEYFGQLNGISKSIESIMHVHNTKLPSVAVISADATFNDAFGVPLSPPQITGLSIDAIKVACSPISIDGDMQQRREFIKHRGLNSSYLEHKILENLLSVDSISAVKALQVASRNGVPIYTINKDNIRTILPMLTVSSYDKGNVQNAVNSGKEVTISRDDVMLLGWKGVGYIARDTVTGSGAYMISNSLAGGGTVKASNPAFAAEQKLAWFIEGQPLALVDATYWWYDTIFTLAMATLLVPIWTRYGYIPIQILETSSSYWVKDAANRRDTWIFYYSGHGGYNAEKKVTFLAPALNDYVYPSHIQNADCKIVFINGCISYPSVELGSKLGIDGHHVVTGVDYERGEAYIGWQGLSWVPQGNNFAMEFWMLMGSGMTVDQAIGYIKAVDDAVFAKLGLRPFNSDDIGWDTYPDSNVTLVP